MKTNLKLDRVVRDYLRFMINRKEITGKGYKNRKASEFYSLLYQDAKRYNCSIFDVLKSNAYFVIKGEFISLL